MFVQHVQYVSLFLVLVVNSNWSQILRTYMLQLQLPVLMCSCMLIKCLCHCRNMNPNLLMLGHFHIVAGNYSDQKLGEQAENSQWLHSLSFVEN